LKGPTSNGRDGKEREEKEKSEGKGKIGKENPGFKRKKHGGKRKEKKRK